MNSLIGSRLTVKGAELRGGRLNDRARERYEAAGLKRLLVLGGISAVLWVVIAAFERFGAQLGAAAFAGVFLAALLLLVAHRPVDSLALIAYLGAVQPAIRQYVPGLPYMALYYLLPLYVLFFLGAARGRLRLTYPLLAYGMYVALELLGLFQTDQMVYGRTVLIPSAALLLFVLMSAQLRLRADDLKHVLRGYVVGAISIAALVLRIYARGEGVTWSTNSNSLAAGDMGPNQVSFLLCVAIFACLVLAERKTLRMKLAYWGTGAGLTLLMILTFSRGGLYILLGAVALYYIFLRRPSPRSLLAIASFALVVTIVFNAAVHVTAGSVINRYNTFDTSNRTTLVQQGWKMFLDNPVLGVGTGNYYVVIADDEYFGKTSGAHNELIRAAAEHGLFGLFAWAMFAILAALQAALGYRGNTRAQRLTFLAIAIVSTFYNGLKLLVQPMLVLIALSAYAHKRVVTVAKPRRIAPPLPRATRPLPLLPDPPVPRALIAPGRASPD